MIVHDYRVKFTDVAISPPDVAKISASVARGFFWSPGTWRPRGYSAIVDQHHIGVDSARYAEYSLLVARIDAAHQAIVELVGDGDGFVFCIEYGDCDHRPEYLFPCDSHVARDARE